jgi:NitT/TauT family transport system ATP-binding protein
MLLRKLRDETRRRERHSPDPGRASPVARGRVRAEDVTIAFEGEVSATVAVEKVNLEIEPAEFVCLLGPSGCGKSTLLNAIAGFLAPTHGRLTLDGAPIQRPGPDRGMVFQQHSLFPWKTVLGNVMFGPLMAGHGVLEAEQTARTFLEMVGLSAFTDRYPMTLSGGMQQRVGIARALANYPTVLLMDEPFGALDAQTRTMMQESLLKIWDGFKLTVIFVTHDIDEAVFLADRVLVMSAAPGRIIAEYRVDLERPRTPDTVLTPAFTRLKKECMDWIRRESLIAFEQQNHRLAGHA